MESKWVPDSAVVARFASLVRAGSSIRAAAGVVGLPQSVAYRLAGELDLPRKRRRTTSSDDSEEIARLWLCLLYTSPSPRDGLLSRMPSSA